MAYFTAAGSAAFKTITINYTDIAGVAATYVLEHDFATFGMFFAPDSLMLQTKPSTLVTAVLDASGTGGVLGQVHLHTFLK